MGKVLLCWILFLGGAGWLSAQSAEFAVSDSIFKIFINSDPTRSAQEIEAQAEMDLRGEDLAEYWLNKGLFSLRLGQMDSALFFNARALKLAQDQARRARAFRYRGTLFQHLDQQDSSTFYLKKALSQIPEEQVPQQVLICQNLSQTYLRLHLVDSVRRYQDLAYDLLLTQPDTIQQQTMASWHNLEGQLWLFLSRYDSAMSHYQQSLAIFEAEGNGRGMASSLVQMADILHQQQKSREAIGYYQQAFEILEGEQDLSRKGDYLNNLGLIYLGLAAYDSAAYCFRQSLSIAQEFDKPRLAANALGNLSHIYSQHGPLDSAATYAQAAYDLFQQMGNLYGTSIALVNLGEVDFKSGRTAEGLLKLREAKGIAEKMNVPELRKDTYLALSGGFEAQNRSDSALYYYRSYVAEKDSIDSRSVRETTEKLKIQFETRIKEEENNRLAAELAREVETRARERLTLVVMGLSLALILLVLVVALYLRNQARKRALLLSEAQARREKEEKARVQDRLTQALKQITEKDALLTRLEKDYSENLNQGDFADKLHERINSNQDWMQFVIEFELVYKGFFEALKSRGAKLSKTDLRMAALIKLNLSNKEIAEVLNISLEGVKKAKQRLKKKLTPSGEEDLAQIIAQAVS